MYYSKITYCVSRNQCLFSLSHSEHGLELGHKGTIPKCQHSHDSFVLKDALGGTFTLILPVILSPLILKLMKTLTKHDEEKS